MITFNLAVQPNLPMETKTQIHFQYMRERKTLTKWKRFVLWHIFLPYVIHEVPQKTGRKPEDLDSLLKPLQHRDKVAISN